MKPARKRMPAGLSLCGGRNFSRRVALVIRLYNPVDRQRYRSVGGRIGQVEGARTCDAHHRATLGYEQRLAGEGCALAGICAF